MTARWRENAKNVDARGGLMPRSIILAMMFVGLVLLLVLFAFGYVLMKLL